MNHVHRSYLQFVGKVLLDELKKLFPGLDERLALVQSEKVLVAPQCSERELVQPDSVGVCHSSFVLGLYRLGGSFGHLHSRKYFLSGLGRQVGLACLFTGPDFKAFDLHLLLDRIYSVRTFAKKHFFVFLFQKCAKF